MEPLCDLRGRILAIGAGASTSAIIDGLLRCHASKQFARPVTLYIVGGTEAVAPLSAAEALLLLGIMKTVRSPLRTVGMGYLTGWAPLLLASGTIGQRWLLPQTLLSLGPLKWDGLPPMRAPIGLQPAPANSSHHQTERLLRKQLRNLLAELNLPSRLFASNRVWTAPTAIQHRLADRVVERTFSPELLTNITKNHEPEPCTH